MSPVVLWGCLKGSGVVVDCRSTGPGSSSVLCLAQQAWHWGRQIIANAEQELHLYSQTSKWRTYVFEETWKQRACLFRKAKGSPVRNEVMLLGTWSLLQCRGHQMSQGISAL